MSATAASTPIAERSTEPIFDREWLNAALIRWKAAEEYVSFLDFELLPPNPSCAASWLKILKRF
jgi:hypothetical protein